MKKIPRIILSPGEPAGIGPDLIIQIAQRPWAAELIIVGDADLFIERAKLLKLPLSLTEFNKETPAANHAPTTLKIIPVPLFHPCYAGTLDKRNADYVMRCLMLATDYCLKNSVDALVTGPVHKGVLNDAGIAFTGHTEFLAKTCQRERVVMLFVTPQMKVAVATTHLPLAKVPEALTLPLLTQSLRILHQGLITLFHCKNPKILVSGLNPHAGENGHLGCEEIDIIQPSLDQLRSEAIDVIGPLPADSLFTEHYLKTADAIFAMYHDQALPVVKYAGFNQAVNVTLGLPIIRTSVDHGTALDLAGTRRADTGSLSAAVELAMALI
jgi:4-hydroxythreonine-4-phosphate dehydrogenase